MNRNKTIIYALIICMLCFLLYGCNEPPSTSFLSQEDYKVELLEKLKHLKVYTSTSTEEGPGNIYSVELGDSGYYVMYHDLTVKLHVYQLTTQPTEPVITADEIIALYDNWDEEIAAKFDKIHDWFYFDETGEYHTEQYVSGLKTADYWHNQNEGFRLLDYANNFPLEQALELEDYIRQNPMLDKDDAAYQSLLQWLGVIEQETASQ